MWKDITRFARELWADWIGGMSTTISVLLMFASVPVPDVYRWFLWPLAVIAFGIAAFRAWRKMFHEARPYESETYEHAKEVFSSLSDEHKQFVKRLCIQKYAAIGDGGVPKALKESGIAAHEYSTGNWYITGPYENILARLVREHEI